jgi:chemotaxis protein MotB
MPVAPARKAGTWKMAYADFLTALMAFFLLMWLVSGVSADDRAEIADYFHNRTPDAATAVAVHPAPRRLTACSARSAKIRPLLPQASSVVLAKEADGIRIDLVDTAERPLFDRADGRFTEPAWPLPATRRTPWPVRRVHLSLKVIPMPSRA